MNAKIIKGRLHEYIERADDKHLEAIYILLEKEITPPYHYSASDLKMLYERVERDNQGTSKSYKVKEAFDYLRSQKQKH